MPEERREFGEVAAAVANLTKLVENLTGRVETLSTQSAPAEVVGLKRSIAEMAQKIDRMEGITRAAVEERERERQALVRELAGNYRCAYTAAELETKPLDELRKLTQMLKPEDYSGRGGPVHNQQMEQRFAEPVPYFKRDSRSRED